MSFNPRILYQAVVWCPGFAVLKRSPAYGMPVHLDTSTPVNSIKRTFNVNADSGLMNLREDLISWKEKGLLIKGEQ